MQVDQIPGVIASVHKFHITFTIERDDFTLVVSQAKGKHIVLYSAVYTVMAYNISPYTDMMIYKALTSSNALKRLICVLDKQYAVVDANMHLLRIDDIDDTAKVVEKYKFINCQIAAPFYLYDNILVENLPADDKAWRKLLNWPEKMQAEVIDIVGDRCYKRTVSIRVYSTMTELYLAINDGQISYGSIHGSTMIVTFRGKAQRTIGQLIGETRDGGQLHYVNPAVNFASHSLPSNFLAIRDGKVAMVPLRIVFDRKRELEDIICDFLDNNLQPNNYCTPVEILPSAECSICLEADGYWACPNCTNQYACLDCGLLAQCPLCRHNLLGMEDID